MHLAPRLRTLALALTSSTLASGALLAQDRFFSAFGSANGTAFDLRAPAAERVHAVHARSGAYIDALGLEFGTRELFGTTTTTPLVGSTSSGSPQTYTHAPGIPLQSITVFESSGWISKMVFDFGTPFPLTWGGTHANETSRRFRIPAGEELVGLHGTATTSLVSSLGIVTRPLLGVHYYGGFGCDGPAGELRVRLRNGGDGMHVGGSPDADLRNIPANAIASAIVLGTSLESWNGIPLPFSLGSFGAANCTIWMSYDVVIPVVPNASGVGRLALPIPADPTLSGQWAYIGGFSFDPNFNAVGLITAGRIECRIGTI